MLLHQSSGRWQLGLSLSLVTAACWGTLPVAETIVLKELDVSTLNWFRFASSFTVLLLIMMLQRSVSPKELKATLSLNRVEAGLLAIATIGLALDYLLYLKGLALTSPANAEVLIQLAPVLMSLGAIAIFKERYTRKQWTGVGVLTLGFILFFHEKLQALLTPSAEYLWGSGLTLLAAIAWAAYALAQKQLLQRLSSSIILLIIYGVCTLMFSITAAPQRILTLSPLGLSVLIFCGLNTLVAYGTFSEALQHWEASQISAIAATTPVITLGVMALLAEFAPGLIAPEHITVLGIVGALVVMLGSIFVALGARLTTPILPPPD